MDQDSELLELSGTVDSIIYKNEDNGYTVLRLLDENGERVTVVGSFPYAAPGEGMIASGTWMTHSVHGRQFKAEFAQTLMPRSAQAIYEYLAGGSVKGIGPATASLIVERFGEKALDVIKVADHIIDLGPEGGDGGGSLVFSGTPEDCAACEESFTGQYLKDLLR